MKIVCEKCKLTNVNFVCEYLVKLSQKCTDWLKDSSDVENPLISIDENIVVSVIRDETRPCKGQA